MPDWGSGNDQTRTCCSTGEQTMRHVDFTPLYRSTVGFDRLFSLLDGRSQLDTAQSYPPYNIERTGTDAYRISMAVAGFLRRRHFHRGSPQRSDDQGRQG